MNPKTNQIVGKEGLASAFTNHLYRKKYQRRWRRIIYYKMTTLKKAGKIQEHKKVITALGKKRKLIYSAQKRGKRESSTI